MAIETEPESFVTLFNVIGLGQIDVIKQERNILTNVNTEINQRYGINMKKMIDLKNIVGDCVASTLMTLLNFFSRLYKRSNDIEEDPYEEHEGDEEDEDQGTSTDLFWQMVIQLSEYLEVTHVYQLSYFLGIPLSPDELERSQFLALMREAKARMIITCHDFSRLLKGLSALTPCEVVLKAIVLVTVVEDQYDRGEGIAENGRRPAKVWHWKKFCEWYVNSKLKTEEIPPRPYTPYMATTEEVKQYLRSMYPHFRVNTIKKHFKSIQDYQKLSEKDKKEVEKLLNRLDQRETCLLEEIKKNWPKWSKPGQQDDEE